MEPAVIVSERRGRKRRRGDVQNALAYRQPKKRVVETRSKSLVGRYVKKEFESSEVFLGKILCYDAGNYAVEYEDGNREDLESGEVRKFLLRDGDLDADLIIRMKLLDELVAKKDVEENAKALISVVDMVQASSPSGLDNDSASATDADSSSAVLEHGQYQNFSPEVDTPVVSPPHMPPSSGHIGVSEEYVSYLFSVYGFLRSFSIRLFLSPFGLDDFVGSLNCRVPNTLLDAIHVALMCLLRRHLEMLSSDGSELASKCLRFSDWSLVDTLTWPVYLVQYLMVMRYTNGSKWNRYCIDVLEKDYYTLSAGRKLMILQRLCDDVLDSEELRAEIYMREESEVGIDYDDVATVDSESGPRRVHPRYSKTSACKSEEAKEIIAETRGTKAPYNPSYVGVKGAETNAYAGILHDGNGDECRLCGMDGTLLCCDGCPSAYHPRCIGVNKMVIPEGTWYCPECTSNKIGLTVTTGTSLRGAEFFGTDSYGQVFLGTCNHLLVLKVSLKSEPCLRYYNQNDIPKVLQALHSSVPHIALYSGICKRIMLYWDFQKDTLPFLETLEQSANVTEDGCTASLVQLGNLDLKGENLGSCVTESTVENLVVSCLENSCEKPGCNTCSPDAMTLTEHSSQQRGGDSANGGNMNSKEGSEQVAGGYWNSPDNCFYMGSHFKSHAYVNNYVHGDFAASAAANLAVLSSEENRVSESHAVDNRKKVVSANNSLQVKAFSSAAARFFWPNGEKKLVEVPRERCSWCLSCKAPVTSKKGCLLNAAASNAIKGAMKILAGLPPVKNDAGSLPAIATYIMFLELALCGLVVGPFHSATYRKQWRQRVLQATTCRAVKALLLELEDNIRAVALSADWTKLLDNGFVESSGTQSATFATGSTQKRGPSGRRGRKPYSISEVTPDDSLDIKSGFNWWRGGMLSKRILQRGVLPCLMVKKAARQGGHRKIPGICYAEGSEIPKRSRQFFWRAAVELSKNASQLALQVRYLDLHVRWNDLVRPEQNLQDGKASEAEASAFRNAFACDKRNVKDKITYGISFAHQKHLPSRVMKNIVEVGQSQDGREKFWFSETHIPLYLIKEYEAKVNRAHLPLADKSVNVFSKLERRHLKEFCKDIFSYLSCKRDKMDKCCCASCQLDVFLGMAVKCCVCQGFFHEQCTVSSAIQRDGEVESLLTCKQCYRTKTLPSSENSNESPSSHLLLQKSDSQTAVTTGKGAKRKSFKQSLTLNKHLESSLEMKLVAVGSSLEPKNQRKLCSWGLIWKKNKKTDEKIGGNGFEFRVKNVLLKGNSDSSWLAPVCQLCHKAYSSDLMYICCETCKNWYHAEAVELEESEIFDLVGFKCCRCRRIRSPVCPFMDPESKEKVEGKRPRTRAPKARNSELVPYCGIIPEKTKELGSAPPVLLKNDKVACRQDSPLVSRSTVQQFTKHTSGTDFELSSVTAKASGTLPPKLAVRRQMKDENIVVRTSGNNHFQVELSTPSEPNFLLKPAVESLLPPHVEWDVTKNGFEDGMSLSPEGLNYQDMDFEPQSYFSFAELIDSDNGGQLNDVVTSVETMGEWTNSSAVSRDGFPEQSEMRITNNQPEPTIPVKPGGDLMCCRTCSLTEPCPDLCCQICGLWVHSCCSPWDEQSCWEENWRCGNCREWR